MVTPVSACVNIKTPAPRFLQSSVSRASYQLLSFECKAWHLTRFATAVMCFLTISIRHTQFCAPQTTALLYTDQTSSSAEVVAPTGRKHIVLRVVLRVDPSLLSGSNAARQILWKWYDFAQACMRVISNPYAERRGIFHWCACR